jgi:hypothetical protein
MSPNRVICGTFVIVFGLGVVACGQGLPRSVPDYRPVPPLPAELGFSYHHASTALEGALRGQAAVTHAAGNYWLSVSQAMICHEIARGLAIENDQAWITFRTSNRQRILAGRDRRKAAKHGINEANRQAKYQAAYELTSHQFDRVTGVVEWPQLLRNTEYDGSRSTVEPLIRERLECPDDSQSTTALVRELKLARLALRDQIGTVSPKEYISAQKFLVGLLYETEYGALKSIPTPSSNVSVAARTQ